MYFLPAFLISYWTSVCSLLYLSLSFFFFLFLALAWALCFWLIFLLMSVFIQWWVCFGFIILVGTLLSIINFISVLNDCHILSICWWVSFLKVDPNSAISFCMLCTSAFFHRKMFRLVGLGLTGLEATSSRTISWSLFPMDGNGLQRCLNDGCVVKKQIKCIFLPRWEIH